MTGAKLYACTLLFTDQGVYIVYLICQWLLLITSGVHLMLSL